MAHQKKLKEDLRSVWNEWSTPHDWGLWQDNPKPTAVEEVLGGADAPPEPEVGAEAGGAVEVVDAAPPSPAPHTPAPKSKSGGGGGGGAPKEEEEEEEEGGGGGGGGGGAPKVPGFHGYTPSKAILELAKKVRMGTEKKETLVARLHKVSINGVKVAGEKAVSLATALAHLFDGAVQAVGKVVAPPAPPAKPARSQAVQPKARAASVKPSAPPAPAPAPAPPAPKGSPAPAPAASSAAKQLKPGVRITKGGHYYLGERRIPASQAFK